MDPQSLREALASLPDFVEDEPTGEMRDTYSAVSLIAQAQRKHLVQQGREWREIASRLDESTRAIEPLRAAIEREQERAVLAEAQVRVLGHALIEALDTFERMAGLLARTPGMQKWAEEADNAYRSLLQRSERAGLVPIASVGDAFDHNHHDMVEPLSDSVACAPQISVVEQQGYVINGIQLRRASVRVG